MCPITHDALDRTVQGLPYTRPSPASVLGSTPFCTGGPVYNPQCVGHPPLQVTDEDPTGTDIWWPATVARTVSEHAVHIHLECFLVTVCYSMGAPEVAIWPWIRKTSRSAAAYCTTITMRKPSGLQICRAYYGLCWECDRRWN